MAKITIAQLHCFRCGHDWYPRGPTPPGQCPNPKCRSALWDRPTKEVEA